MTPKQGPPGTQSVKQVPFQGKKSHEVTQAHLSELSSQKHPAEGSEEVSLDSGGLHIKVAC